MEYIKGMPSVMLLPMLADWVLSCEIKRQKSKNINGNVTRSMRENLMKIYCAIGEIRNQKESMESSKLKKQLDEMKGNMEEVQKENKELRKELEEIKRNIKEKAAQTPNNVRKENSGIKNLEEINRKNQGRNGRVTQLGTAALEKRAKTPTPRRELTYTPNPGRFNEIEEAERINNPRSRKDDLGKKKRPSSTNREKQYKEKK